ncbi:hypothetical protein RFI_10639 [Reticulomyxa filosa]|uniref:NAC-A/B domain-containing protein n=1 Tax=Reticulomyxa filosa TaxID=46433 RepID=X6NM88_RETFI|nr:hypothetical protein RFI_10639 [Reticulomyxa filosa]|eukprot:ETO26497.1 hypothetical protein RFI_10639 [Reticulomyxa filosa]
MTTLLFLLYIKNTSKLIYKDLENLKKQTNNLVSNEINIKNMINCDKNIAKTWKSLLYSFWHNFIYTKRILEFTIASTRINKRVFLCKTFVSLVGFLKKKVQNILLTICKGKKKSNKTEEPASTNQPKATEEPKQTQAPTEAATTAAPTEAASTSAPAASTEAPAPNAEASAPNTEASAPNTEASAPNTEASAPNTEAASTAQAPKEEDADADESSRQKLNKQEKKARKTVQKLGFKQQKGFTRVTIKKSKSVKPTFLFCFFLVDLFFFTKVVKENLEINKLLQILFVIAKPDVFKAPNNDAYIIFGNAKIEDMSQAAQSLFGADKWGASAAAKTAV